ncbi:protein tyrosine phosphatase receptor type C-associated protein [Terrapene carolina triunguis]|uniref:protein tyrosine phosphatase receptor type C-associated protein n=1 Tax=Terrapene triunguis TaxID=2587831 RepID=UPI000CEF5D1B|nr:protein tyrosine phosphatase receptor type C-associated protein [Terrapene carolina triunguis]
MHSAIRAPRGLLSAGLALLMLPGAALGSDSNPDNNSVAVVFLVFLLLLLLLVLALAWRKLSHDSEGRYHPRHLCQPHRLLAALARRWRELQGQVPPERHWQDKEEEEDEDEEEEETLQRDEEEGGGGKEQQSEEEGTAVPEGTLPHDVPEGALEEGGEAEGASAGGLLSDLHSFSGTAAWEDSAAEGGSRQHVTAL